MKVTSNAALGVIEHRGRMITAYIPLELLTLDARSYGIARSEYFRTESVNPENDTEEQSEYAGRARSLNQWIDGGCQTDVRMDVDLNLFLRTSHLPAVVTFENIDSYLDALLSVSDIGALDSVSDIGALDEADSPQFLIRNTDSVAELWLTENRSLRNARRFAGPDVEVVETTTDKLKEIIAIEQLPSALTCGALVA